ncbi:MAG: hypothetical protein RLZZ440_2345, partial [Planctomycetota bacterium]
YNESGNNDTTNLAADISGSGTLSQTGTRPLILSGDNSLFTGEIVSEGKLYADTTTALGTGAGATTLNTNASLTGTSTPELRIRGVTIANETLNLNSNATGDLRTTLASDSANASEWSGQINLNGDGTIQISANNSGLLTISGDIAGPSFAGSLYIRGNGAAEITGNINMPTGNLAQVNAGTWTINSTGNDWGNTTIFGNATLANGIAGDAIPDDSPVTLYANATLDISAHDETIGSLSTFTDVTDGHVVLGDKNLTVAGTGSSTTFVGDISGSGSLIVTGRSLGLSGTNPAFTGEVRIDGGEVRYGGDVFGTAAAGIVLENGGTLTSIAGGAIITINDNIRSDNSGGGNTIRRNFGSTLFTGEFTTDGGSTTIDVITGNRSMEFSNSISGTGGIDKTGSGTLIASGTASYAGDTLVSSGTLLISGALTASNVTVASGAAIAGGGTLGGDLFVADGGLVDITGGPLTVQAGATVSFGSFDFDDISGLTVDATTTDGIYTILSGGFTLDPSNISHYTEANKATLAPGKFAWFESGSLNLVVVPEPSAASLIGLIGFLGLLRRRRSPG